MRRCLVLLPMLGAAACSLFTDLGEFAASEPPAGDAGPGDVGEDGSPATDAAAPEHDAADDAAGPTCGTAGTFCDEFERELPKGAWTQMVESVPILSIDPATLGATTRSLKVQIPGSAGEDMIGYLMRAADTHGTVRRISVEAKVRVDAWPVRRVHAFTLKLVAAEPTYLSISLGSGTVTLTEQDGAVFEEHPFSAAAETGWQKWSLAFDESTAPATATAAIGSATTTRALTANVPSGPVEVYVGDVYSGPGSELTYWIDDVRIVTTP